MSYKRPTRKELYLLKSRDVLKNSRILFNHNKQDGAHNLASSSIILSALSTIELPSIEMSETDILRDFIKILRKSEDNNDMLNDVILAFNSKKRILDPLWQPTVSDSEKIIKTAEKVFEFASIQNEEKYQQSPSV